MKVLQIHYLSIKNELKFAKEQTNTEEYRPTNEYTFNKI